MAGGKPGNGTEVYEVPKASKSQAKKKAYSNHFAEAELW